MRAGIKVVVPAGDENRGLQDDAGPTAAKYPRRVCYAAVVEALDRIVPRIGATPVGEDDLLDVAHSLDQAICIREITGHDLHAGQDLAGAGLVTGQRDGSQPAGSCSSDNVPTGAAVAPAIRTRSTVRIVLHSSLQN